MILHLVPPPAEVPEKPEEKVTVTYRFGEFYFTNPGEAQKAIAEWNKKFPWPPIYLEDR